MFKYRAFQFSNFLKHKGLLLKKCTNKSFLVLFSFCSIIFCTNYSFGQDITLTETLKYLNTKLDGKYKFDVKNGQMFLKCFKDGKVYRDDNAYLNDIDPFSVTYIQSENAVVMKCLENSLDCIRRTFKQGTGTSKNVFKRCPVSVEGLDKKSIDGIQNALVHMIRLVQDSKYRSDIPFEATVDDEMKEE
jgi:hypothetical protein